MPPCPARVFKLLSRSDVYPELAGTLYSLISMLVLVSALIAVAWKVLLQY
jgi:formate hydrogenlyase subunit 4